jgi:hypothetical protein
MRHVFDDGGRAEAGFRGSTGDCVTRSIAIATGLGYREVYDELRERALASRWYMRRLEKAYGANARRHISPRMGVPRRIYEPYLAERGFAWTPTMRVGSGCTVHLRKEELPSGRLVVTCSRHLTAVIDGVIHDTFNPARDGTRCVYGYYQGP